MMLLQFLLFLPFPSQSFIFPARSFTYLSVCLNPPSSIFLSYYVILYLFVRFHPPAVVGVMGSAAACANLLGLSPAKSRNALGIAASFAGAPMANAGTEAKPLHAGKAARYGGFPIFK